MLVLMDGVLRRADRCPARFRQAGLTLIELMIATTLGIAIVGSAISLLLSAKSTYTLEAENARLLDTGRFVIDNVTRAVRQSAFQVFQPF